jgi:biopolymer transport protein ExbD
VRFVRDDHARRGRDLPLTSMIDVFFLLLVYFLTSATITPPEEELAATLSAESESDAAANLEPQIVRVLGPGGLFAVASQTLASQDQLLDLLRRLPKEPGVFVEAEDNAPVWAVAAALQACRDAGFQRLTYVAPK